MLDLIVCPRPVGPMLNVSPARQGWGIDGRMIPSAVGAPLASLLWKTELRATVYSLIPLEGINLRDSSMAHGGYPAIGRQT
jgi:hypothetical protein